jgi:hypothetical protein
MTANGLGPDAVVSAVEARKIELGGSASKDTATTTANQEALGFHPLANMFPLLAGAEFDELVADIKANGLRETIVLFEDKILDGRNRYRACAEAGVIPKLEDFEDFSDFDAPTDPVAFVISKNIRRRHLTAEQKRDVIAKLIAAQPEKSDRQIAKQVKADHKTVGAVRKAKEATGEISPVEKRVGADGKARKPPARKQPKKQAKPAAAVMADTKRERGDDLAEQLQAAKIRMAGLESEIGDLRSGAPAGGGNLVDQALKLVSRMSEAERKQFRDRLQQDFPPRRGRPPKEPQAEAAIEPMRRVS